MYEVRDLALVDADIEPCWWRDYGEVEAYAFGTDKEVPAIIHQAQYGDVVLHNHPSGNLEPSSGDITVASMLGDADLLPVDQVRGGLDEANGAG